MGGVLRVVIDTNVLISGLFGIKNSPSSCILRSVRSEKIILVTSPPILEEVDELISRKRIINRTKMSEAERKIFMDELIKRSEVTAGKQFSRMIVRDLKDDKILACAYEANADYIVTGDKDLLVLKEYRRIKIVSPRRLIELENL